MPRRSASQSRTHMKVIPAGQQRNSKRRWFWLLMGLCGVAGILSLVLIAGWMDDSPKSLRSHAEAAARAGDWSTAVKYWQEINATEAASGVTYLGEARANLALSRAFQAESCFATSRFRSIPPIPEPYGDSYLRSCGLKTGRWRSWRQDGAHMKAWALMRGECCFKK